MDLQKYNKDQLIKEVEKLRLALYQSKNRQKTSRSRNSIGRFEESIDLLMEFKADGKITKTNKNWRNSLGYQHHDLKNLFIRDIIHPNDLGPFKTMINYVMSEQIQVFFDVKLNGKNGEIIHASGSVQYNVTDDYLMAAFHDITNQVNAEKAKQLYYSISNLTIKSTDLADLFRSIHKELNQTIEARNFFIAQFNFDDNTIHFPYLYDEHVDNSPTTTIYQLRRGICEYIYHHKQAKILKEGELLDLILDGKINQYGPVPKSILGVPFRTEKGIPGVIGVQSYENENAYSSKDLELLNFISAQVVLSVERKYNDEMIGAQAARLQSILDSSNHIIWSTDEELRLTSFNQNFEIVLLQFFGIKARNEARLKDPELFHKLSAELQEFWGRKFLRVLQGKYESFEVFYETDGKKNWYEIFLNPIYSPSNKVQGISGIAHDVTEKKSASLKVEKSEERFRNIFESFQDIYFNCRFDGEIILISPSVKDMIGFQQEEVTGTNVTNYYLYTKKTKDLLKNLVRNRRVQNFEATLISKDGKLINSICNVRLVRDENSREITIEGVARDITQLKQTNRELMNAKNIAENSLKVKDQFLANMSHEIRTPMNGVIGMVDLLSDSNLDSEQRQYVNTIKKSSGTLMHILNDILDLSKIEAGKMKLRPAVVKVEAIFEKVLSLFQQLAREKEIKLSFRISNSVPTYLWIDETRMLQILSNLCSNALKFTDRGGKVNLFLNTDIQKDSYRISVEDNGIGISFNDQQQLFKLFTQVDNSSTKSFSGTGLGLAISKQLTNLMGGSIGVTSEPDQGSVFWFSFKAKKATSKEIAEQSKAKKSFKKENQEANVKLDFPVKVLIVDDNAINRQVAEQILKKIGVDTTLAEDGQSAVDLVENNEYDLILMDIQMPGMDGVMANKKIKELRKKTPPVIAMTAYSMKDDQEKFIAAGLDDYLSKPIISEDLVNIVVEYTAQSRPSSFYEKNRNRLIRPEEEKNDEITNDSRSESSCIDFDTVKQLRKYADSKTILSFYEDFEIEAKSLIIDSINAEKTSDFPKILSNLHTLKGNAGTLGIRNIELQAKKIENNLKSDKVQNLKASLKSLLENFNSFTGKYQELLN